MFFFSFWCVFEMNSSIVQQEGNWSGRNIPFVQICFVILKWCVCVCSFADICHVAVWVLWISLCLSAWLNIWYCRENMPGLRAEDAFFLSRNGFSCLHWANFVGTLEMCSSLITLLIVVSNCYGELQTVAFFQSLNLTPHALITELHLIIVHVDCPCWCSCAHSDFFSLKHFSEIVTEISDCGIKYDVGCGHLPQLHVHDGYAILSHSCRFSLSLCYGASIIFVVHVCVCRKRRGWGSRSIWVLIMFFIHVWCGHHGHAFIHVAGPGENRGVCLEWYRSEVVLL